MSPALYAVTLLCLKPGMRTYQDSQEPSNVNDLESLPLCPRCHLSKHRMMLCLRLMIYLSCYEVSEHVKMAPQVQILETKMHGTDSWSSR
jgi:hypothetical protein